MAVALPAINQSGAGAKKPHNFGCGVPLALGVIKLHLFRGSASLLQTKDGARAWILSLNIGFGIGLSEKHTIFRGGVLFYH
jgi:hypothetical protein